ncbi:hypothetical protein MPL1032_270125 [Mesorhizobium plurifarium]|uniref:Uncharacterized protein n=1 Tax=Mesorhizobium plurifarium TaxID=69974 RepID=A0A0K2W224_MESPL|nr:hypothetical protein MPL1032_270125 [Mesorhizobium plurifarium]
MVSRGPSFHYGTNDEPDYTLLGLTKACRADRRMHAARARGCAKISRTRTPRREIVGDEHQCYATSSLWLAE